MPREANPPEERVLQSLRQSNVITKAKMDECLALLEALEPCSKCGGTGTDPDNDLTCGRCDGTGQQRVIK